ncbi:MAG: heme o synthase [Thermaerobacter sp.]|nr:heme o synthase [Thermaerobacter sp.]
MGKTSTGGRVARDYLSLAKPAIVLWLVITAYCAMVVGYRGVPPIGITAWMVIGLGLSAGGAHAVNMWYDRDIDPLMQRTQDRPVAAGRIPARNALLVGVVMGAVAVPILGWGVNWLTAASALAGYLFYLFVYTFWLKRRTPQNIVIGGAAGAFPPVVGWAAATGHLGWAPLLMFLVIVLWTPPHFWALALYRQEDYRRAGIPMMPVVRGGAPTKRSMIMYAVLLMVASVLLYFTGAVGGLYLAAALVLGGMFVLTNVRLLWEPDAAVAWAKRTFGFSLIYVVALFGAMVFSIR